MAKPAQAKASLPTGTVTFFFTDIEGSTRLLTELGDAYAALLERHAEIMRAAIEGHAGVAIGTEGDSFFAVFPSAVGAIAAAVQAQRALAAASWPDGAPVMVRIGLHTGEGRLGGDDYVGLDVHRAARIAAAGHGGQVLLSDATRPLVEASLPTDVELRDLGQHRLKDFERPIRLAQLEIGGLPTDFPELKTLDVRPGNLPEQLTSFVGRRGELEQVKELIGAHRLVTLTGPGGTGKTRLALRAAADLLLERADGAFFVDLASTREAELIPLAIAQALRVAVDPSGDALSAVRAHLRDRDLLLVLDNFEQLIESAPLIEDLLAAAPGLRVVLTSRMPLGIYGEQEFEVPPFETRTAPSDSDAVTLFADRARAVRHTFELTDEHASTVGEIVTRLDGLPLAIELAAGQVRVLSPEAILSHLDRRLPLLTSAGRGRPERQQTMRAAIEWSYDLLDESERRLFARLSAFPAGCSLEGAEAVGDAGDLGITVLQGLGALIGKSLLRQAEGPDGEPRFAMLETILEYAGDRLRTDFDADATHQRMAEFYIAFAQEAEPHLTTGEQSAWLDRCQRESANLRQALDWAVEAGQADIGLRTATDLWRFWQQRGPLREGRRALDRLLALPGSPPGIRGKALGAACILAWWDGDFQQMRQHAEEALPLVLASGDRWAEVEALYNVGFALLWSGVLHGGMEVDRAEEVFRQSQSLAEDLGDRRGIAKAARGLGMVTGIARGDARAAVPMFERAVALAEEIGDRWEMSESLVALGNGHRFSGDKEGGKRYYLQAIDLMVASGNRQIFTGLLFLLSALEGEMGRHERVARLWGAAENARSAAGVINPPAGQRIIGDPVAAARQAIGDDAVERGLAEGRAMDLDATIEYAHAD